MGPVQVLVVGFDSPAFSGDVLAEFTRLREVGIVRLVDLLLVSRDEDGTLEALDAPGGPGIGLGLLAAAVLGRPEDAAERQLDGDGEIDLTDSTAWSLAEAVPVGSVAAVALIEHMWAVPLNRTICKVGGHLLEETWLADPELEALEALEGLLGEGRL